MGKEFKSFVLGGLLVVLGLGIFVSPIADSKPDGLNRVAQEQGFADEERSHALEDSPVAGYGVEGVDNERLSTALSAVIGISVTFGTGLMIFGFLRAIKDRRGSQSEPRP
jgi:hypothetical protein